MDHAPTDWTQFFGGLVALVFVLLFAAGAVNEMLSTEEERSKPKKPLLNIPDIKLPFYMIEEEIVMPIEPAVNKQTLQKYTNILKAIGFSAKDAKIKANSLLIDNPNLTPEDLLRRATK